MNTEYPPRIDIAMTPTPLHVCESLSKYLKKAVVYMKRDDMTDNLLGGNKTRKLEFLMADALTEGADAVITAGAAQSNHCRQVAAAASRFGLDCYLMLGGAKPERLEGNLLLDVITGAHVIWCGEERKGESIPSMFSRLKDEGRNPYIIPYGGSNARGALGYVRAANELIVQARAMDLNFDYIFIPTSSGGTLAGLSLGMRINDSKTELVAVNVDRENRNSGYEDKVCGIAHDAASLLGCHCAKRSNDINIMYGYDESGYANPTAQDIQTIERVARFEGIILDPVYTAPAMRALVDMIEVGKVKEGRTVLFWHTGGAPSIFSYEYLWR